MNAYRIHLLLNYLVIIIGLVVQLSIWNAVYKHGDRIAGYGFQEIIVYTFIAKGIAMWISNDIDQQMAMGVRTGDLIFDLLKPVNLQIYYSFLSFGKSLVNLIFVTSPFILIGLLLINTSINFVYVCYSIISLILALEISILLNYLVGLASVYVKNIDGLLWGKVFLVNVFSGLLIPIEFFPKGIQIIINSLPFKAVGYIPVQILMGRIYQHDLLLTIGFQVAWVIIMFGLGQYLTKLVRRTMVIQGG